VLVLRGADRKELMAELDQRVAHVESLIRQIQGLLRPVVGSPEGVVAADAGALAVNTTGGTAATLFVKEADAVGGDPTLGWAAK
jgi:hypothetical protein